MFVGKWCLPSEQGYWKEESPVLPLLSAAHHAVRFVWLHIFVGVICRREAARQDLVQQPTAAIARILTTSGDSVLIGQDIHTLHHKLPPLRPIIDRLIRNNRLFVQAFQAVV
jgi:hypothetical protein